MENIMQVSLQYIKGIGPKRASLLFDELGLKTVEDLLEYFPFKHEDRSVFHKVKDIRGSNAFIQIKGIVTNINTIGEGRKKRLVAKLQDETGILDLVWFKGIQWIGKNIKPNMPYIIYGKPTKFGNSYNIAHPEIEPITDNAKKPSGTLQSYYNTSDKMKRMFVNSKVLSDIIGQIILKHIDKIPETLPSYILEKHHLMGRRKSLINIHFPKDLNNLQQAIYRLKFEELFYIQLGILKDKIKNKTETKGYIFPKVGNFLNSFYRNSLPFNLTNAQKKVLKEIRKDLGSGKQMNRLLQGDVGSGKTMVALMTMLIAADNDYQSCLMAPTEILANQHFESLSKYLEDSNINTALLTGNTKQKDRKQLHKDLANGKINLLIGTHALLEETVQFKNLGLTIIDEQHRFGVAQRSRLRSKNKIPPHVLVMSATPIPRTLAMTVYGDLDVSVIDELPPGRKPVQTLHIFDKQRPKLYKFIDSEIAKGRQVYIVYPIIKKSEKLDYENLETGLKKLQSIFPSPQYHITMVHGQMKTTEKDKAMQEFLDKKSQILVATTVIEVGVNIPNASIMVIESAERFGLSQLHQLRGRVGRGNEQSYCFLCTSYKIGQDSRKRMATMAETNDGFEISEVDMKIRGPGDIKGTQQSGIPFTLKISNLTKDSNIMQYVREVGLQILQTDPTLSNISNQILLQQLQKRQAGNIDWSVIS